MQLNCLIKSLKCVVESHSMVHSSLFSVRDNDVNFLKCVSKCIRLRLSGFVRFEGMSEAHSSELFGELLNLVGLVRNDAVATFDRGSVLFDASNASEWTLKSSSLSSNRIFIACERRSRSKSSSILVIRYVVLSQPAAAASAVCCAGRVFGSPRFRWWPLINLQFELFRFYL